MADPIKETAPSPTSASPTGAAAPPVAAAVVAAEPSSSALPANELAAAKPAEPAKEPGTHETPTLLETVGDKPAEAKPAEKAVEAKPGEAKPAEAKPAEAKPAEAAKPEPAKVEAEKPAEAKPAEPLPPIDYKYTIPETLKLDDANRGELNKALDEFRANPEQGVQKIVDVGSKLMTDFATNLKTETEKNQRDVFAETNKQWHRDILADPTLGGSGYQTTSAAVARMRDMLVPSEMLSPRKWDDGSPRMSEFQEFCRVTGAGNNRVFWHILHNAARYLDEPQHSQQPTDIRPPADIGRDPNKRGGKILYDNPRSNTKGQG